MNHVPETVLQESLDLLESGEPIEAILTRYPEMADALRPFLETAAQVASFASQPSLAAKQKSQKQFLAHAESLKAAPIRPSRSYRLRQILLPIASLALLLLLFATAAVSVSSSAIPGDVLYPVKRLVETVRLNLTSDPEAAVALIEQYREERIREVQALLRTNRTADVMFDGLVENIEDSHWTVASIQTFVTESTVISGTPQLDEWARVNGRTQNGRLFATTIEMLTGSPNAPEANPTPQTPSAITATPSATADPTATEATPSATAAVDPTLTATSTETATATATATAIATASPTPTNDDNGNDNDDNGNDDDNDNGGNDNEGNDNDDNGNDNDDDDNGNDDNENDNGNGNDNDDNDNDDDDD